MKKTVLTIILAVITVGFIFGQSGTIRDLTGEVELKHEGSSSFVRASAGDTVTSNTIISTGFRSSAIIVIGSSTITVTPLTRLSLAEIQSAENSEELKLNLQAGRVRLDVNPPAGIRPTVTVQSPSATASVRGTSFEMDADSIVVTEGTVVLTGTAGLPVLVTGGNATFVSADGLAADPVDVAISALAPSAPVGAPPSETVTSSSASESATSLTPDIIYN